MNTQRQMAASRVLAESGRRPPGRRPTRRTVGVARRRQSQRRRRDVLMALLAGMGGSFLLGMVHGLQIMLLVNVMIDLMFVGYIALLIRLRNLAAEREVKLMFLPPSRSAAPGPAPRSRGYARREPVEDADYDLPPGYSDVPAMLMRRAN
jgi:hypothetical protein